MISALCLLSFSAQIYASVSAGATGQCTESSPCSYKRASWLAKCGDNVTLLDKYIADPSDLDELRDAAQLLSSKLASINGRNVTVDGALLRPIPDAFILFHLSNRTAFSNFTFTRFKYPIIAINNCYNFSLSHVTFRGNHVAGGLSLVSIAFSEVYTSKVHFLENSADQTSLLLFSTTTFSGENTLFERNFAKHNDSQPLIVSLNSILYFTKFTFSQNHSPFSPLILFTYRTFNFQTDTVFDHNHHSSILVCEGHCNISLTGSAFASNKGSILLSMMEPGLFIHSSAFENNSAGSDPLFASYGGYLSVEDETRFSRNSGESIFELSGKESRVDISKSSFFNNSLHKNLLHLGDSAFLHLEKSKFSGNLANEGTIHGDRVNFSINKAAFAENIGTDIVAGLSNGSISKCSFDKESTRAISLEKGSVSFDKSKFKDPADKNIQNEINLTRSDKARNANAYSSYACFIFALLCARRLITQAMGLQPM